MYHGPAAGAAGTLAFTGAVLDPAWAVVSAVALIFAGLALRKIAPKRKGGRRAS